MNWFLRMALWARNPPSTQRVILVLSVIGICLALYAVDRLFGWPEWLTPDRVPGGRLN
ncbi:MAG: hypothetical protein AAFR34_01205 [Pseudomonadota bacterium]